MTHISSVQTPFSQAGPSPAALFLFLDAVRCWGAARRARQPVMEQIHARLRRSGCEQLAPALDSLMRLGERVLGHPFRTGRGAALSHDENLLIGLLQDRWQTPIPYACSDELACAFCCALRSTQILMAMELGGAASASRVTAH